MDKVPSIDTWTEVTVIYNVTINSTWKRHLSPTAGRRAKKIFSEERILELSFTA